MGISITEKARHGTLWCSQLKPDMIQFDCQILDESMKNVKPTAGDVIPERQHYFQSHQVLDVKINKKNAIK